MTRSFKTLHDQNITDQYKREVVIARVMATGQICYPDPVNKNICSICLIGPCYGPLEKYND